VRGEVSAHMLHRLEVAHGHTVSNIYDARKKLINERLVLTHYLDGIRTHTLDHDGWVSVHIYVHTCACACACVYELARPARPTPHLTTPNKHGEHAQHRPTRPNNINSGGEGARNH
jgi:hypothetical protein